MKGAQYRPRPRPKETPLELAQRLVDQARRGRDRWNDLYPEPNPVWEAQVADAEATLALRLAGDNKTIVQDATNTWVAAQPPTTYAKAHATTSNTNEQTTSPQAEWDPAKVLALADSLGRKLEVPDVTDDLYAYAMTWLASRPKPISFEFLRDLRDQQDRTPNLSVPQAKGILNCVVADARRAARGPAPGPGRIPDATSPPGPVVAPPRAELSPGMYVIVDEPDAIPIVFKVQAAIHGSGHLYAKRLIVGTGGAKAGFEFERGAISRLTERDRMSLEQAKAFGAIYGVCCVCGALLTNEDSIEAGIGPVCSAKLGG